jgi:hypothetical protein
LLKLDVVERVLGQGERSVRCIDELVGVVEHAVLNQQRVLLADVNEIDIELDCLAKAICDASPRRSKTTLP